MAYLWCDNETISCVGCGPVKKATVWVQTASIKYVGRLINNRSGMKSLVPWWQRINGRELQKLA
jgi:hypothetical protein